VNYNNEFLIAEAQKAREYAYAPYSNFLVGAVLVTTDGKLYHGCNIENASYPATNCAERTAFFKAISDGEINFSKIAIVGAPKGEEANLFTTPCGICRQVMMEFCDPETFIIIMPDGNGGIVEILLKDLMPFAFGPNNIC
jgi:cytidine deaminase